MTMHNPSHPGPIIKEAIEALGMTVGDFATHIGVSRTMLSRILNEKAGVTADMSLRISEAFGQGSSDIWFRVQNKYDFWKASQVVREKVKALNQAA